MADLQSYIMLFLLWLISTILARAIFSNIRTKPHLPPGPRALPIIGHLHLLDRIPHQAFHKLSNRYGPLIHLYLGSVPCVVASSPEIAREFLKTHESSFSSRPISSTVHYLTYGSAGFGFGPYGDYWKFMKKICMSELLSGRTLDQLAPIWREETQQFLHSMLQKSVAGEAVIVGGELMRLKNNIISRMMMSKRCSATEEGAMEVGKIVHEITEIIGKFNLSDFIWFCKNLDFQGFRKRIKDVRERFDVIMDEIIKQHEEARREKNGKVEGDSVKDLLHILLDISGDENAEIKLSRDNIKAFILEIFFAGTDTSAITIEWALAEIINHPTIFEKAREEIDSVVGKNRFVEESDILNLPYIQAIVKEALRLHPAAPLALRESTENCKIGGYDIPAKTRVFMNIWAIGRDPNHWDNPLEFRPERFMNEEGSNKSQLDVRGQHFHLLPFGSGRRGCPGISLALLLVPTTLACMIQCFDWKVGNGSNATVDMTEGAGLTLLRANPLVCVPVTRLNPFPST